MSHETYTGIPVDLLLIGLSTVLAAIGGWVITELKSLRKESNTRGVQLVTLTLNIKRVFEHLKLTYITGDEGK